MQKLFPSVSEAASAGPASPDTPAPTPSPQDATDASDATVAGPVRPFAWPPPEEDLDDWHVFQFGETAPAAAAPTPLKPSQTPTLKIVSPLADRAPVRTPFETPATEPIATPFGTPATEPIPSPFGTPATAPLGTPAPVAASALETFATPETTPIAAPAPFATPDTAPMPTLVSAPVRPSSTSTTIASLGLSGVSEQTLPARRVQTVAPVPVAAPVEQALKSTTVEVIARSTQAARAPRRSWSGVGRTLVIGLALLATGEAAYIATMFLRAPAATPQTAALFVQSQPAGADIFIDGQARGKTPVRLDLPPGRHLLELRKDRIVRKLPLVLAAGTQATQYIELHANESEGAPPASAPAPNAGASSGSNANTASHAAPGAAVTPSTPVSSDAGGAAAASAASVRAPARPAPTIGWLVVRAPVTLSILRNGEAIGNSDDGRLAIGPGRHELELSNSATGYREAMAIQITAGRETVLQPELPQSTLDVESTPRARVSIDGRDVGETPLNQLALTIGPHEIVFRHPDFPDKTVSTFIRVGTPAHVTVDLSTP
jgi:hypothetical protein